MHQNACCSAEPCLHFGHCWWHSQGNCSRGEPLGLFVSLSNDCFELLRYSSWTKFLTYCWTCWACGIASITTHNSWVASDWKHADFPQPHTGTQPHSMNMHGDICSCVCFTFCFLVSDCPLGIHLNFFQPYFHFVLLCFFRVPMSKIWTVCHFNWISMPRLGKKCTTKSEWGKKHCNLCIWAMSGGRSLVKKLQKAQNILHKFAYNCLNLAWCEGWAGHMQNMPHISHTQHMQQQQQRQQQHLLPQLRTSGKFTLLRQCGVVCAACLSACVVCVVVYADDFLLRECFPPPAQLS